MLWKLILQKLGRNNFSDKPKLREFDASSPPYKPRQHVKKQRHHFADKGPYNQHYGFPVVMYTYESWTIKKAEC